MTKLPEGWETKRLDEIADIVMGQSPPGSSYNEHGEGQPFFQGKTEFGEVHPTVRKYTTAGTKFAKAGDILMSVRAPVGPTNIADIDCVIGRGLAAIRAKTVVSQDYLRWSLKHLEIDIQSKGTGTTFDAITGETLRGTLVALPPIDEQHKIVELLEDHLSRLDAALADVKQAKLKAAQFRRSLLQAAFTGNLDAHDSEMETELAEDWRQERFGDIFKVKYGKAIDKSLRMEFAEYPVVGSAGVMTYTKIPLTTEPTIVIGRKGNVGSIQIFKEGCYPIDTTYYMPTISDFDIDFLTLQLTSLELVKLDSSTATPSLRREDLENVQLVVPRMEEQLKIVALLESHLSRLDSMLQLGNVMEKQSAGFRRSLLQAAFTGQLTKEVVSV